jgi:hypothetical protein
MDGRDGSRPADVGRKFHADGSVRGFPGNTVLCHLPAEGPARTALMQVYDRLAALPARRHALLPPSSWHMTVFEGVCDQIRDPVRWPADLPLDAPLAACTDLFAARLRATRFGIEAPIRVAAGGVIAVHGGFLGLRLEPADPDEHRRLRSLRDRLSAVLGLRVPIHVGYGFHLTIGYQIDWLTPAEQLAMAEVCRDATAHLLEAAPIFTFGVPEFCTFEDMHAFRTLFHLS